MFSVLANCLESPLRRLGRRWAAGIPGSNEAVNDVHARKMTTCVIAAASYNQNQISSTRDKSEVGTTSACCCKPCHRRVFSNHGESVAGGRSVLPGSSGVNQARKARSQERGVEV